MTGNLEENCSPIFKTLLEYGAPTNIPSSDGDLPIHIAVSKCSNQCLFDDNLAEIMTMIESNKDLINIPNKNRTTPFLGATKFCSLDVIQMMVNLGADVKSKGMYGNTVLHEVMEKVQFDKDVVSFLLLHDADINAINDLEETPLITCTKRGSTFSNLENITFLLENGADPNICAEGFNSAFLEAIKFDSFDVAFVLKDAKANINHIGKNGNSALHVIFSKEYFYESDESTSDDEYTSSSYSSLNPRAGGVFENTDYSTDDDDTGEDSIHCDGEI
ncbi:ankyrin repeat and SOCS box protein 2-like [Mytilus edulis]|uniref:ankyrin repeat and SOCS box protein 2-like n=1 Tax=Mytilus edulis TaxID=6550 RepID=UPI0039EFFDDA